MKKKILKKKTVESSEEAKKPESAKREATAERGTKKLQPAENMSMQPLGAARKPVDGPAAPSSKPANLDGNAALDSLDKEARERAVNELLTKGKVVVKTSLKEGKVKQEVVENMPEGWYTGKRALTPAEERTKAADMNIRFGPKGDNGQRAKHSMLVKGDLAEKVDKDREANWIPPSEVEKMPQWKPTIMPVVQQVIAESVKDVKLYMETTARPEREQVCLKLASKVHKRLPDKDYDVVLGTVEAAMFELMKDQGVSNRSEIATKLK